MSKIKLVVSPDDEDVAYLCLPAYPAHKEGQLTYKTVGIRELMEDYKGPDLYFDFNKDGVLIGIEILN